MSNNSQVFTHQAALSLADSYRKRISPGAQRISIFGNCHYQGIFQVMSLFNPSLIFDVRTHIFQAIPDEVKQNALDSDFIFVTDSFDLTGLGMTSKGITARIINIPSIFFAAFHPDILRINPTLPSFYPTIHSRIVVESFLRRYSKAKTLRHFSASTYAALGYYDALIPEKIQLSQRLTNYGFKADELLPTWFRDGCFMHLTFHPKIKLIKDLVGEAMLRNKITIVNHNIDALLIDNLADTVWPVYPDIAEYLCIPEYGSYLFKSKNRVVDLEEFIAISYATYKTHNMATFNIQRVDF